MNHDASPDAASTARCTCKVGRSSRRYGIDGLDGELRRRHAEGASLRELERYVNRSLLEGALREADLDVFGTVDSVFRVLVDDDVSAGERTEMRERLARAGVDVDALEGDFVSYQTVRTHLRDCLDVETGTRGGLSMADARGTIEWSRSRNEGVIRRTVERLRNSGELAIGDPEISQVIRVTCSACNATYLLDDLLRRGGCDCSDTE